MGFAFATLLLLSGQPEITADQLMRQMEEKLSKAETIYISFKGRDTSRLEVLWSNGSLEIMKENKVRVDVEGKARIYLSNGTDVRCLDDNIATGTPEQVREHFLNSIKCYGLILGIEVPLPLCRIEKGTISTSALKLGVKERVGKRNAQLVEYKLTLKPDQPEQIIGTWDVKLWLDAKTGLPLKRSLSGRLNGHELAVVEVYKKFVLDKKIDEKRFELPSKED